MLWVFFFPPPKKKLSLTPKEKLRMDPALKEPRVFGDAGVVDPTAVVMGTVVGELPRQNTDDEWDKCNDSVCRGLHGSVVAQGEVVATNGRKLEEEEDTTEYLMHTLVKADTTLLALAVRYGSTEEGIMRANAMLSPDLDLLPLGCVLRVPLTHEQSIKPASDEPVSNSSKVIQRKLAEELAKEHAIEVSEALFYVSEAGNDLAKATALLKDDEAWEKKAKKAGLKPKHFRVPPLH